LSSTDLIKFIYFLTKVKNLGNVKIKSVLSYFTNPQDFYKSNEREFRKITGIDSVISSEIAAALRNKEMYFREFENISEKAVKENFRLISILDDEYPDNLRRIFDTPVLLYCKGHLTQDDRYSLSIVGTRSPTEYGKYNCEKFTEAVSILKIPVISGFARGIDTIVHRTSLKFDNINYAVLGSGIDVIYPYENKKLYSELAERGVVITEFPPGTKPDKVNFPRRNRIISGISLGTLVIESGIKGGALLTAEIAVDQDREVFAVPGYINSKQSEGTNELIKRGQAKLVTCIDDILVELEQRLKPFLKNVISDKTEKAAEGLSLTEEKIYSILNYEPVHIDRINELAELPVSDCLVNLLSLEFKSLVRQIPGKYFLKC
jgi:DNA processing protein